MEEKELYSKDGITIYLEEYDVLNKNVILKIVNNTDDAICIHSNQNGIFLRSTAVDMNQEAYTSCMIFPETFCAQNHMDYDLTHVSGWIEFLDKTKDKIKFDLKLTD